MNKLDKEILNDCVNKMLAAKKIDIELTLMARYDEIYLVESKASEGIIFDSISSGKDNVYVILSYKDIKNMDYKITSLIENDLFSDEELYNFDETDEEFKRKQNIIENTDRKVYEEKWFDNLYEKAKARIEKMNE